MFKFIIFTFLLFGCRGSQKSKNVFYDVLKFFQLRFEKKFFFIKAKNLKKMYWGSQKSKNISDDI